MSVALVSYDRCICGPNVVMTNLSTDYQEESDRPDLVSPGPAKLGCFDLDSGMPVVFGEIFRHQIGGKIEEGGDGSQSSGFVTDLTHYGSRPSKRFGGTEFAFRLGHLFTVAVTRN